MKFKNALAIVAVALSVGIAPVKISRPSVWASESLIVSDGPRAGQLWDSSLTPQLVEILDSLAPGNPHNKVAFRKSAQIGATLIGTAWCGYMIANAPCKGMTIFPTITSVQDFNREKLEPTIQGSPQLNRLVRSQTSRSSRGSTAQSKSYPGGSWVLTGANSTVDLRSKTVKVQHRDEIDDWPLDLDGQGDPEEMADARLIAFHATGDYMVFKSSTPTIKGISRIDIEYLNGDQRNWHVKCPHCGEKQKLEFGGKTEQYGLKFNTEPPYDAHYVCRKNGCIIEHWQKIDMVQSGSWVAENPENGLYPSYHLDSLSSLLTTWDNIAEKFLSSKSNPTKLKGFVNLWLGQSWEERGEAPDFQKLLLRRETYARRHIPPGALFFTLAVDVQKRGLFYEVVGWGEGGQSWSIDIDYIDGDETADINDSAWTELGRIADRRYPDAYGNHWPVDLIGVDSGFNSQTVYRWVRGRANAMALKGQPGWYHPAMGTPSDVSFDWAGRKIKGKVAVWPVGTWSLKSELYAELRKQGKKDGSETDPEGYCHFSDFHDEKYFRQLTAEIIKERTSRGRIVKEWTATGPNHYHDCRIYGKALAEKLGLSFMDDNAWKELALQRAIVKPEAQSDMFDPSIKKPDVSKSADTPQAVKKRARLRNSSRKDAV